MGTGGWGNIEHRLHRLANTSNSEHREKEVWSNLGGRLGVHISRPPLGLLWVGFGCLVCLSHA